MLILVALMIAMSVGAVILFFVEMAPSRATDVANRGSYLRHMGRLLADLSHTTEAKRALQRALELAPEDSPQRAEIAEAIAAIR